MPPSLPKEKHKQAQFKKFHAIDESGIARVGAQVAQGDVFINKYTPVLTNEQGNFIMNKDDLVNLEYKPKLDCNYKGANPASVDRVVVTATPDDPYLIKIMTR